LEQILLGCLSPSIASKAPKTLNFASKYNIHAYVKLLTIYEALIEKLKDFEILPGIANKIFINQI
jgi:hypothetical protein